jgi:hypothetical protein
MLTFATFLDQTKLYMTGESSAAPSDAEHALLEDEK